MQVYVVLQTTTGDKPTTHVVGVYQNHDAAEKVKNESPNRTVDGPFAVVDEPSKVKVDLSSVTQPWATGTSHELPSTDLDRRTKVDPLNPQWS